MSRHRITSTAVAALLLAPFGARAQTDQAGELVSVATWEIEPSDFDAFLSVVTKVVEAANQAKLGEAYSWSMWHSFFTVTLVGPFNRKELDDPNDWMNQFTGTPGQATLMEAFQEMEREGIQILSTVNEIQQAVPAWTYQPSAVGSQPLAWVNVMEVWLKSGQQTEQAWSALIGDWQAFLKDIGYPYPIWANRVRYGDQRIVFVTAYGDPGAYNGVNSMRALAEKHNATDRWQGLIRRVAQLTNRIRETTQEYLPMGSYQGPSTTGGQP